MILHDLVGAQSQSNLFETCRTKLHGTMLRYTPPPKKNVVQTTNWWYCEIYLDESEINQDTYMFGAPYGDPESYPWISISRADKPRVPLRSLDGLDTEPAWPKAGNYWVDDKKLFIIKYKNTSSYKAGLSSKSIHISDHAGNQLSGMHMPRVLDEASNPTYPSLQRATELLIGTKATAIPVSRDLLVAAHPYVEGPVLHWETHPVGLIHENRVLLTKSSVSLEEYLQHLEIDYAVNT